ncbi:helix-turn-helix domain-containing protein [Terribacillus sp. 179-K 1B1 HS]|uniref:response regulator transcription factor n=1 Tax=Terribacillus sp. 179-K 1B1 HS TaxID=3142388 RepID=UPI0039A3B74A
MLRAALFDDEFIVVQGLQTMVCWDKFGIELIGTAQNGVEALDFFEANKPDIILTDIRMPGLDGLALIERILVIEPTTLCIVFSGFNDTAYLKKAIKLGVVDYLEKPVTLSKVEDVLERTIKKANQIQRVKTLETDWELNQQERLKRALLQLMLHHEEGEREWEQVMQNYPKKVYGFTVLALATEDAIQLKKPNLNSVTIRSGKEYFLVLLHLTALSCQQDLVTSSVKGKVGIGRTYTEPRELYKSYQQAQKACRYAKFLEVPLLHYDDLDTNNTAPQDFSGMEKSIFVCLRTIDEASMKEHVMDWMKELCQTRQLEIMEREILRLVYLGLEVAKENGAQVPGYDYYQEIKTLDTSEEMENWLLSKMISFLDGIRQAKQTAIQGTVEWAKVFLENHYHKDITLQDVAARAGMNTTYFSMLFKETTGTTYIKYLTSLRIEKAKELLLDGGKVKDVSEKVGYHSYRHFTEVFKKHTGISPGLYREKQRKSAT